MMAILAALPMDQISAVTFQGADQQQGQNMPPCWKMVSSTDPGL